MFSVFWRGFGVYENVIKNKYVQKISEDVINEGLEECGSIAETEWHHQILKISYGSFENGFPFIPLADREQVVGVAKVKFGEDGGAMNQFKSRGD